MGDTLTSQQRAKLIREMAADLKKSRRPLPMSRSSDADTHTSIEITDTQTNIEDSGPITTSEQEIDFSRPLPQLRPRAMNHSDIAPLQQDFQINTSAMNHAFQATSQSGSRNGSRSGSDHSMSIEQGRGFRRQARTLSPDESFDQNNFSPAVTENQHFTSSPPTKPVAPISRKEANGALRRDAKTKRALAQNQNEDVQQPLSPAKAVDFGSAESRQTSVEGRSAFAAAHARVLEEDGATQYSDDLPSTVNITSKSTRFVGSKARQTKAATPFPRHFSASNDLLRKLSHNNTANKAGNDQPSVSTMATPKATPNGGGTQQSFMIPDMPNITELISGTFTDGTPVFSRTSRSRTSSRFSNAGRKSRLGHVKVSSIPVPEEEEAIYVSLKVLQDKIADLENDKVEAEAAVRELQEKNHVLEKERFERRKLRRSDSGLGTTSGSDAGDEHGHGRAGHGSRRTLIEKTRKTQSRSNLYQTDHCIGLEVAAQKLQEQLNSATGKASIAEAAINNLTKERDSAISQLGIAFVTTEQLKIENEQLVDENEQLKLEIAQLKQEGFNKSYEQKTTSTSRDFTEVLSVDPDEGKPEPSSRITGSRQAVPPELLPFLREGNRSR